MLQPDTAVDHLRVIMRSFSKVVSMVRGDPLVAPVPAVPRPLSTGVVLEFHAIEPWASRVPVTPVVMQVKRKSSFTNESTRLVVGVIDPVSKSTTPPVPPYLIVIFILAGDDPGVSIRPCMVPLMVVPALRKLAGRVMEVSDTMVSVLLFATAVGVVITLLTRGAARLSRFLTLALKIFPVLEVSAE